MKRIVLVLVLLALSLAIVICSRGNTAPEKTSTIEVVEVTSTTAVQMTPVPTVTATLTATAKAPTTDTPTSTTTPEPVGYTPKLADDSRAVNFGPGFFAIYWLVAEEPGGEYADYADAMLWILEQTAQIAEACDMWDGQSLMWLDTFTGVHSVGTRTVPNGCFEVLANYVEIETYSISQIADAAVRSADSKEFHFYIFDQSGKYLGQWDNWPNQFESTELCSFAVDYPSALDLTQFSWISIGQGDTISAEECRNNPPQ